MQDHAKKMIFLHQHIHKELKARYLTVNGNLHLWQILKTMYNHEKMVITPKGRYD